MALKPSLVKKESHDCYAAISGRPIWCHKSRISHMFKQINDYIFMGNVNEKQAMYILYTIYGLDITSIMPNLETVDIFHITKYYFYSGYIMKPYLTSLVQYYRSQLPNEKAKEILSQGMYQNIFN